MKFLSVFSLFFLEYITVLKVSLSQYLYNKTLMRLVAIHGGGVLSLLIVSTGRDQQTKHHPQTTSQAFSYLSQLFAGEWTAF